MKSLSDRSPILPTGEAIRRTGSFLFELMENFIEPATQNIQANKVTRF
jgi:hypothetical protein